MIVCEDLTVRDDVAVLAARIAEQFRDPFELAGETTPIAVSIGVAFSGPDTDTPLLLLRRADDDMYRVKRAGARQARFALSDAYRLWQPADLESSLQGATARGEMSLSYQPIVTTANGRLVGLEALLRWEHPVLGAIPPTAIIPFTEQAGMIHEIGDWALSTACAQRAWCERELGVELTMAVNVSVHQFMASGFADSVRQALLATDTPPGALTLEVTETVLVSDVERATRALTDLRELGVKLSLDDFGTGYSSLRYLLSFTFDHVKIDRDFIKDLVRDPTSQKIVTAVIELAHELGVTVIAEGVETAAQHTALADLGCDFCQGYYFARPLTQSDLQARLADGGPAAPRFPLPRQDVTAPL